MLMSLTMRFGPAGPDDSRGAISVVAIRTPSFSVRGQKPACPEFDRVQTRTLDYKASALPDAGRNPPTDARGTRLGTYPRGAYPDQDSVLKNCAMLRNLLYRDTSNSEVGIFLSSA